MDQWIDSMINDPIWPMQSENIDPYHHLYDMPLFWNSYGTSVSPFCPSFLNTHTVPSASQQAAKKKKKALRRFTPLSGINQPCANIWDFREKMNQQTNPKQWRLEIKYSTWWTWPGISLSSPLTCCWNSTVWRIHVICKAVSRGNVCHAV